MTQMLLSIVIPAYNEEGNLPNTIEGLHAEISAAGIPYEIVIVNDNSTDGTRDIITKMEQDSPHVRGVHRHPPGGFGRAIRSGIEAAHGDAIVIYMADASDHPKDAIAYYRKLEEGYDAVYGSRFIKGSTVENYPPFKRVVNRIVNKTIQYMFFCQFNDLTNAFKAYRSYVIEDCGPYRSSHFNITIEMSLSVLIRKYQIAQIPISWTGRTWGASNLKLRQMGRRYLSVLLKIYAEKLLIADDLIAEKLAKRTRDYDRIGELEKRIIVLEDKLNNQEKMDDNSDC